ncbi:hypothetical protein MR988_00480 [bacterium]|nr:hypothetical protein [bacterium]
MLIFVACAGVINSSSEKQGKIKAVKNVYTIMAEHKWHSIRDLRKC